MKEALKLTGILSLATAVVLMTGCGSSSSGDEVSSSVSTITGIFVDSAVEGLTYSCSSGASGVTNASGEFTCKKDDNVTFSLEGYVLGSAIAASTVTPYTLYPDNTDAAINVAQLLQTIDTDNNASNGITIDSTDVTALQGASVSLDAADFDTAITDFITDTLVTATDAQAHLDETVALFESEPVPTLAPDGVVLDIAELMGSDMYYMYSMIVDSQDNIWIGLHNFDIEPSHPFMIKYNIPTNTTEVLNIPDGVDFVTEFYDFSPSGFCEDVNGMMYFSLNTVGYGSVNINNNEVTGYSADIYTYIENNGSIVTAHGTLAYTIAQPLGGTCAQTDGGVSDTDSYGNTWSIGTWAGGIQLTKNQ